MKYRNDFVTNSSSSSFILSFKDKKDIKEFIERCSNLAYDSLLELLVNSVGDFIEISSYVDDEIFLNPILDLIKKNKLPKRVKDAIEELKLKNIKLKPNGSVFIPIINPFEDYDFELFDKDSFKEIDTDEYSVFIVNNIDNRSKSKIIEFLKGAKEFDFMDEILKEYAPKDNQKYFEFLSHLDEFKKGEVYKGALERKMQGSDFEVLKKRIEDSYLTVMAKIWDSNGGVLEWAIRNGFVEAEFRSWFVYQLDVG